MAKTMLFALVVVAIGVVLIVFSFFPTLYSNDVCNTFSVGNILVQYPSLIGGVLCCLLGILRVRGQ